MSTKSPTIAVVVTLLIVHDGKILLAKRTPIETRAPEDLGKMWHLPGGTLEYGEHPVQAAVREAKEEIGLDVRVHQLMGVTTRTKESHCWHGVILTYLCTLMNPHDEPVLKSDEIQDYTWLNYEDLDDAKLLPGIRDQIDFYFKPQLRG
jgi:ADP-ribose pyrophosphatase YjhB (NUDIX family)